MRRHLEMAQRSRQQLLEVARIHQQQLDRSGNVVGLQRSPGNRLPANATSSIKAPSRSLRSTEPS